MTSKDEAFGTTPPPDLPVRGWKRFRQATITRASTLVMPLARRFARDHIGGETVGDALCVARRLAANDIPGTLGLWPVGHESPRAITDEYLASIEALADSGLDGYLSIKPPSVNFDLGLADELGASAKAGNVRLHCDSHGIESVGPADRMIDALLRHLPPARVGTTLPGRWRRSLDDADHAINLGLNIRLVKGQWPDPADPARDLRRGFLELVDRVAGRARHVAVASQDLSLLGEATARLRDAGTAFEVEAIYGPAMEPVLRWAREQGVAMRAYIPYGKGFIPNAIGHLRRNPRLALRVIRGMATGGAGAALDRDRPNG
jgi:proline dehydrogenase